MEHPIKIWMIQGVPLFQETTVGVIRFTRMSRWERCSRLWERSSHSSYIITTTSLARPSFKDGWSQGLQWVQQLIHADTGTQLGSLVFCTELLPSTLAKQWVTSMTLVTASPKSRVASFRATRDSVKLHLIVQILHHDNLHRIETAVDIYVHIIDMFNDFGVIFLASSH